MAQLNVIIPDELDEKFRKLAAKKFGLRKGFLSKAVIEALEEWVEKNGGVSD